MQRRFLKFIFGTIIIGTAIIMALSGCSIYEAIDNRLHPTPVIEEEATYKIDQYTNGKLDVDFTVSIGDGDIAMFYYSCREDNDWDSDRVVGSQHVIDGKAKNTHSTRCNTKLLVQVVVYNNFSKKSQRHNSMAWIIDIRDYKRLQAKN